MQLGSLGTIAALAPRNLAVIVFDNGVYQITGSQPALTSFGVDLVAIARGAGLAYSAWAEDETHYESLIDAALRGDGPVFIGARTDDQPPAGVTERDAARIRIRFMDGIRVEHRSDPGAGRT
jgi:thiamine pyrophosphate-dependent acetolactate synthase large subunit-like protein